MKLKFSLLGASIGLFLGVLSGFGLLNTTKKSLRETMLPITIGGCALIFTASGYMIGRKLGNELEIEIELGIGDATTEFFKQGRYWVAETNWKDKSGKHYILITSKSSSGILCSYLNGSLINNHNLSSGSQINVKRFHLLERNNVFSRLKANHLPST